MANSDIDPNEHPIRANRGIVIVVVTLGVLIVLGLGGLVYGIAMKAGKLGEETSAAVETAVPVVSTPTAAAPTATGTTSVLSMTAEQGRLYLHVRRSDGGEVVRAFDVDGALIYEIPVVD